VSEVKASLSGRQKSEANLVSGFKGSKLTVEWQGLKQTTFLLAHVTNVEFRKHINEFHGRRIGILTQRARKYFEQDIRRPDESGARRHARETQKFTFGKKAGGAFVGVVINEPATDQYGFGYPDIARADTATNFVWRTLEFGLKPHPAAISHPFGPVGSARFPTMFTFKPFTGPGGVLYPRGGRGSGSAAVGTLVTPQGRVIKKVAHPGIAPKQFITRAFNDVAQTMDKGYRTVVAQTYKDFK
jgi:hypothetical protein